MGGIVNSSRTFGVYTQDMLGNEYADTPASTEFIENEVKVITYRYIAWMTALRNARRSSKQWETTNKAKTNKEWGLQIPEKIIDLEEALQPYLSKEDMAYVQSKANQQTAMLYLQSHHLKKLKEGGLLWEFSFIEMEALIKDFFSLQGKSERIKNFPFPRQYATLNHYFIWLLLLLLPMAMIPQIVDIGHSISEIYPLVGKYFIWLSVPFYTAVAWIFHTMERIGRTGENPFEGTSNDVPISTIARGIEIDLRQNLGESDDEIPTQFSSDYNVQW